MFRLYGVFLEVGGFFCSHGIQFWWTIHIFLHGATNPWLHHIHFYASLIPQSLFNNIQQIQWWMCPKMGYTLLVHHVLLRRWSQRLKQNHATSSFLDRPHCHMIDCWWHFRSNAIKFLLGIHKITIKSHWHPIWWISNRKSMAYHH